MFFMHQKAGNNSTNIQVKSIHIINKYIIITNKYNQSSNKDSMNKQEHSEISNVQSQEIISSIANYSALFFCIKAIVVDIGESYAKRNPRDNTIIYLSNVFFSNEVGERFRITIPTSDIPFARESYVTVIFVSDLNENLISCGLYDDFSGDNICLNLSKSFIFYFGGRDLIYLSVMIISMLTMLFSLYFGVWFIYVYYKISIVYVLFAFIIVTCMSLRSSLEMRQLAIKRIINSKYQEMSNTNNPVR